MKGTNAPSVAVLAVLAVGVVSMPTSAQLPATNMGKYIHQPGDNQYSQQTQMQRHGAPAPPRPVQPVQVVSSGGYRATPAPRKPDPTIEPIAADEPIPVAGFPPLPDRLDLPVGTQSTWAAGGGGYGGGSGGGGGYGGGAAPPGAAADRPYTPPSPTFHQHYGHVPPGAFKKPSEGGGRGYYKAVDPGPVNKSGGGGGYKVKTPGSDYYGASSGGPDGPPAYTGASGRDLKALGKEPKLTERQEQGQAPEAPTPVVVSQSTTQDLSLPEDEFEFRRSGKKGKLPGILKGPLNSVGGLAGVRF